MAAEPSAEVLAALGEVTPDKAAPEAPADTFDIVGGPMGAMEEEAARYVAGPLLRGERTHYTRARLGSWAHSAASLTVLAEALKQCPGMAHIDFANIVAGRMEAEALVAYKAFADALEPLRGRIRGLDFSYNAIGPKGLAPLRGLLTEQAGLEELLMVACGVSAETQADISTMLLFRGEGDASAAEGDAAAAEGDDSAAQGGGPAPPAGGAPTLLRRLVFDNNLAGDEGGRHMARIVAHSPRLEEFQMSASRVEEAGAAALLAAIGRGPRPALRRLDLHDNLLGPDAAPPLAAVVTAAAAPALEELDVGDAMLGDEGAAAVLAALLTDASRPLALVRLDGNDIVDGGAALPLLAALVATVPALTHVRAAFNDIGAGVRSLAAALNARAAAGHPPLALLSVATNFAHPKALGALVEAAVAAGVGELEVGGNMGEAALPAWQAQAEGSATRVVATEEMEPEDPEGEAEAEAARDADDAADLASQLAALTI